MSDKFEERNQMLPPIAGIAFDENRVVNRTIKSMTNRRVNGDNGFKTGISVLDAKMNPMIAGELIGVLGLSSNYKTGLMSYITRQVAAQVKERGWEKHIVVYATWEQTIEEHTLMELANTTHLNAFDIAGGRVSEKEWDRILKAAYERYEVPVWLIGTSIEERQEMKPLTMDSVARALGEIDKHHDRKIAMVVIDYLQLMETGVTDNARIPYANIVKRCKAMAKALGCPVILASQAKQELDKQAWCLPTKYDSSETAAFTHTCDKILSVWMPKNNMPDGERFGKNKEYIVSQNLLMLGLMKQRYGSSPIVWPLWVDPSTNEIVPMVADTPTNGSAPRGKSYWQEKEEKGDIVL